MGHTIRNLLLTLWFALAAFLLLPVVRIDAPQSTVLLDRDGRLLGATIAYHPTVRRKAVSIPQLEQPKTFILYAIVGVIEKIVLARMGTEPT